MPDPKRQTRWHRYGFWAIVVGIAAALAYFLPAPVLRPAPALTAPGTGPTATSPTSGSSSISQALVAYVGDTPVSTDEWQQARMAAEVLMKLLAPPGSTLDEPFILETYLEDRLIAEEAKRVGFSLSEEAIQAEEDRLLAVAGLDAADLDATLAEVGIDRATWRQDLRRSVVAASYLEDVVLADTPSFDKAQRRAAWLAELKEKYPIRTLIKAQPVEGLRPGNTPPDFALPLLDGETVRLSDFKGQPVLLNFWATWCLPCREEMPLFEQAYRSARDDGFVLLAVDVGEDTESVQAFVDELGLTFPIALDRDQTVTQQYRVYGIPTSFYLDRDGVIQNLVIGAVTRMPELQSRLDSIGVDAGD